VYAFIEGTIAELTPASVVINCGGVGYDLAISLNTFTKIKGMMSCRLFVHLAVREDAMVLYGFADESERSLFRHLISVSGVGTGTARLILSSLSTTEVTEAIVSGKVAALQRVKGIGGKTAQRIIIDLKDKLGKDQAAMHDFLGSSHNRKKEEALSALSMLGFNKSIAEKALDKLLLDESASVTVEQLIKSALKIL